MEIILNIENFQGPLDLLLHLVEKKKVKLSEIRIMELIEEYLEIINNVSTDNLQYKVEFILVTSELLEIKALELIKSEQQKEKEENLKRRLEEYQMIKEIYGEISKLQKEFNIPYRKSDGKKITKKPSKEYNLKNLKQLDIFETYKQYIEKNEEHMLLDLEKNYSLEEETEKLIVFLYEKPREFIEIFNRAQNKTQLIYIFLSLLELYKDGIVDIGDNKVYKREGENV